jgi:hypothetical protein
MSQRVYEARRYSGLCVVLSIQGLLQGVYQTIHDSCGGREIRHRTARGHVVLGPYHALREAKRASRSMLHVRLLRGRGGQA